MNYNDHEESALNNRYQFVALFDVENGNPNGDPDNNNRPRVDEETGQGIVTDVCLKRKIRNYVEIVKESEAGYNILIKSGNEGENKFQNAYKPSDKELENLDDVQTAKKYVCANYYDARTFGAVIEDDFDSHGIYGL